MSETNRPIFNFFADLGERIPVIGRKSIIPGLEYKGPSESVDLKLKFNPDEIKIPDRQQSENGNKK